MAPAGTRTKALQGNRRKGELVLARGSLTNTRPSVHIAIDPAARSIFLPLSLAARRESHGHYRSTTRRMPANHTVKSYRRARSRRCCSTLLGSPFPEGESTFSTAPGLSLVRRDEDARSRRSLPTTMVRRPRHDADADDDVDADASRRSRAQSHNGAERVERWGSAGARRVGSSSSCVGASLSVCPSVRPSRSIRARSG